MNRPGQNHAWHSSLLVVLVILAGCGSEPSHSHFSARDSLGVRVLTTNIVVDTPTLGWTLDPKPTIDVGASEDAAGGPLFAVADALRLPDGTIVVEDGGASQVRFYSPTGTLLRTSGRQGKGPGEFQRLLGLALTPRGDILVFDPVLERLTVLAAEGDFRSSTQFRSRPVGIRTLFPYRLGGVLPDSSIVLFPRAGASPWPTVTTLYRDSTWALVYRPNGAFDRSTGEALGIDLYTTGNEMGGVYFGRRMVGALHGDELYETDGGDYEVRVYGSDGTLRRIYRLERGPRRPITERDERLLRDHYLAKAGPVYGRQRVLEQIASWPRAESKPWISTILVDATGALWVEEYAPYWDSAARTWGVFAPDGPWLGSLELPTGFTPFEIGADYVLGVTRDQLEVEHLQMFRLRH